MKEEVIDTKFIKKIKSNNYLRMGIGAIVGSIAGLLYWHFIGCNNGTCPLTSNVYKTVIIFTFMGGLIARK